MTKIKMLNDRIIFDGHADTRQECETITLMCDNLAKSKDFKTVRYESGYAEFEKVGKTDELKFAGEEQGFLEVIFDSGVDHIVVDATSERGEETTQTSYSTSPAFTGYFISDTITYSVKVYLKTGKSITSISRSDSEAISIGTDNTFSLSVTNTNGYGEGVTVTLSTAVKQTIDVSTLSGWANLSTGNHQITVKTKASGYADSAASNAVTVSKAATPHSVSVASYASSYKTYYEYSTDDGATWNDITATGQIVASTTQIKFRASLGAIPSATSTIRSSQLGFSITAHSDDTMGDNPVTSDNFVLTQDITDIICEAGTD